MLNKARDCIAPLNEAEKGQWSPRALLGHKRPFYIKESWENLAGVSGLDSGPLPAPAGFGRIRGFAPGGRLGVSPRGPPPEGVRNRFSYQIAWVRNRFSLTNVRKGHRFLSLNHRFCFFFLKNRIFFIFDKAKKAKTCNFNALLRREIRDNFSRKTGRRLEAKCWKTMLFLKVKGPLKASVKDSSSTLALQPFKRHPLKAMSWRELPLSIFGLRSFEALPLKALPLEGDLSLRASLRVPFNDCDPMGFITKPV